MKPVKMHVPHAPTNPHGTHHKVARKAPSPKIPRDSAPQMQALMSAMAQQGNAAGGPGPGTPAS